jgi:filamentous hemagglutinin
MLIFKAVGSTFDAMAKDPNLVNKVLVALERQIVRENDKYSAMEPREKGRFIGEVMFAMFNPEGSSEAGEASLKMADGLASRVDRAEGYLGDLRGEVKAGAGGRWDVLNERASPDVVQQVGRMSCVSACGEMLTEGAIKQKDLLNQLGAPVATKYLARFPGPMWDGGPVDEAALEVLLHRGSWVADLRERMGLRYARLEPAHAVIVDGVDSSGNIMIRDPAQATRYEMTRYEFMEAWTGVAVFRK